MMPRNFSTRVKLLRAVALACVCTSASLAILPQPAWAQNADATAASAQPRVNPELRTSVDRFWHFAKVANYAAASAEGQQILQTYGSEPVQVMLAFEQVAGQRRDNLDQWLIRWQGAEGLGETATELFNTIEQGRRARATDPAHIQQNIERLTTNERAYQLALGRLRDSGESAVERMVDYLRDADKAQYHSAIRRALRDLGRISLNPLVAATHAKDPGTLIPIIDVLGDLGYDAAVPYLVRLRATTQDSAVRQATERSLARMGVSGFDNLNAAELYFQLAEKLYYDNASISADTRRPTAFVWYWDDTKGLVSRTVPSAIFNEIMAMRSAEYALELDPNMGKAVSLWLAANFKREAELPEGQTDATRADAQPDAHYYAVSAGTDYSNAVLTRALADGNAQVALGAVLALREIAGRSNILANNQVAPLVQAMRFPDRLVRIHAAETIALTSPQQPFTGSDRVVPTLAEAVAQTGKTNVLVIVPGQDRVNGMVQGIREAGFAVEGADTVEGGLAAAAKLPAVDVIVVSEELGGDQVQRLMDMAAADARLEQSAKLIITRTAASPFSVLTINNPLISVTQVPDPAALREPIDNARQRAGGLQLDEAQATELALNAARLLERIGWAEQPVLDVSLAEGTLLNALTDERADLVRAAGDALATINSPNAQQGIYLRAAAEGTDPEVVVSLYNSLAASAKRHGNLLDEDQVTALQQTVENAENLDVRSAAAEAHGALNLPAEKAKQLIVNQSQK